MTRSSLARVVLWALVLGYSFFFAGHLFELTALIPNWQAGTPEAVGRYRDFLSQSGPGTYFLIVLLPTLLFAILTMAVTWSAGRRFRQLSIAPLLILIIYGVWTQLYFVPINHYIGRSGYDAITLKMLVDGWVFWEVPRAGLVALGLAVSIGLMERSRQQTSSTPQPD